MFRKKSLTLLVAAVLAALSMGITWGDTAATTPAAPTFVGSVLVNYFSNANTAGFPDGTVQLTNAGSDAWLNVCAMIYVFYPDQELAECCGCALTPDGLNTLSVNTDLTGKPLTGIPAVSGVIKIVSATDSGVCNPAVMVTPVPAVVAWGTHILAPSTGGFWITETEFQSAPLSRSELAELQSECHSIQETSSPHGECSCGTVLKGTESPQSAY
jgi:hypothetical protein